MKQAAWIVKFLEDLKNTPSAHGIQWTRAMITHYNNKFERHCKHMPRTCRKPAGEFKQRIAKVLHWLDKQP